MGSNACSSPNTHSPSSSLTGTPTFGSGDSPPALEGVHPACPSLGPLGPASQNGSGNASGQPTVSTKCGLCHDTFTIPKVLSCLHTFCQPCLEKVGFRVFSETSLLVSVGGKLLEIQFMTALNGCRCC